MSKPAARNPTLSGVSGYETSWIRTGLALGLVLLGIAWIVVYTQVAMDAANFVDFPGAEKPDNPFPWMADLGRWNYVIGFGLISLGLMISAHKLTPLGRGRGVVVGMLGCFLIGLAWIVTFYFIGQDDISLPVMDQLGQWNLIVGVAFMAVGFTFATKWE